MEKGSWWSAVDPMADRPLWQRAALARKTLGNRQYPPLDPAPGTYVHE